MMTNFSLNQRNALGICVGIAALIFITLIMAFWQWRSDWGLAHQSLPTVSVDQTNTTLQMIAAVPSDHLFGKSFASGGDVPITSLQLRVTGIVNIVGDENSPAARAYISMAGQPSKIYQIGDSLPYGVKIYGISSDAVMLVNDGHLEKLPLPREPLQFKPKSKEEDW